VGPPLPCHLFCRESSRPSPSAGAYGCVCFHDRGSNGVAPAAAPLQAAKKFLKKLNSPRIAPIEPDNDRRVLAVDAILDRDAAFHFLSCVRSFMASLPPPHRIPLAEADKLYRELGFPRGRSVSCASARQPLLFHRTTMGSVLHLMFTSLLCSLLEEERRVHEELPPRAGAGRPETPRSHHPPPRAPREAPPLPRGARPPRRLSGPCPRLP
uniref:Uncharacterized protein n=1 Tax=Aegilops tauschii subsp. strangulata TaxID=200361 RepID=A0A453RVJ7_AEGTS